MLSKSMQDRLNAQVKAELESEYYYMAMMAWCFNNDYDGFGFWLLNQAKEEHAHAEKLMRYVNEAGGDIEVPDITVHARDFDGVEDIFTKVYEHEQKVTGLVHALVDAARKENDHATDNFLQWYVGEQVEEENNARGIVAKLNRIKGNPNGLFMLEGQLAQRAG